MQHTPLDRQHQDAEAVMAPFAGWSMPMHYGSAMAEHRAVRTAAGLFDVSHMVVCDISGEDAMRFTQHVLANDISRCEPGDAIYSCMLNHEGGIVDDLIAYVMPAEAFAPLRFVLNAARREADRNWLLAQQGDFNVHLDWPADQAILAVQGPQALPILTRTLPPPLRDMLPTLLPFKTAVAIVGGALWQVATTGYTGEQGVELILPASEAPAFWRALLEAGVQPCGLAARDSLRLEAGYMLYGQDMDLHTSPWVSGLAWTIKRLAHRTFIGRDALVAEKETGLATHMVGLVLLGRGVLRHGQQVWRATQDVGLITSGGFSPILSRGIAMARLQRDVQPGDVLQVEVRGKRLDVQVVKLPFVKQGQSTVAIKAHKE